MLPRRWIHKWWPSAARHRWQPRQGVLQLLTMVAPYLGDDQLAFYRDCETIYASMLESD